MVLMFPPLSISLTAAGEVAVPRVHLRLLGRYGARGENRHEHHEDDDADQRHQDQVAGCSTVHLLVNLTPYAVHRARPFATNFATTQVDLDRREARPTTTLMRWANVDDEPPQPAAA